MPNFWFFLFMNTRSSNMPLDELYVKIVTKKTPRVNEY